jgi:RNA polymerase sigma-70 factor (ECF subfamily)
MHHFPGPFGEFARSTANHAPATDKEWVVARCTDADVIAASCDDPAVFAHIYDRHAGSILRFLVRRVGGDGDELLGEVFRIAFERRNTFDTTRLEAAPWLYGIAANLVAKHRRSAARRSRAFARIDRDHHEEEAERVVAMLDADRRWPEITRLITGLPAGEREVLLLYAWEDLSYEQIAVTLDIPVGTVRSRLNRARRRLRESADQRGDEMFDHPVASPARRREG